MSVTGRDEFQSGAPGPDPAISMSTADDGSEAMFDLTVTHLTSSSTHSTGRDIQQEEKREESSLAFSRTDAGRPQD